MFLEPSEKLEQQERMVSKASRFRERLATIDEEMYRDTSFKVMIFCKQMYFNAIGLLNQVFYVDLAGIVINILLYVSLLNVLKFVFLCIGLAFLVIHQGISLIGIIRNRNRNLEYRRSRKFAQTWSITRWLSSAWHIIIILIIFVIGQLSANSYDSSLIDFFVYEKEAKMWWLPIIICLLSLTYSIWTIPLSCYILKSTERLRLRNASSISGSLASKFRSSNISNFPSGLINKLFTINEESIDNSKYYSSMNKNTSEYVIITQSEEDQHDKDKWNEYCNDNAFSFSPIKNHHQKETLETLDTNQAVGNYNKMPETPYGDSMTTRSSLVDRPTGLTNIREDTSIDSKNITSPETSEIHMPFGKF